MIDNNILKFIESQYYKDAEFLVTLHKKKSFNKIPDKNVNIGFEIKAYKENSSQTFVSGKMVVVKLDEDIIDNLKMDLTTVYAEFPNFVDNPGSKMFFEDIGSKATLFSNNGESYICIIHNLWIHPLIDEENLHKSIINTIQEMLVSEFNCKPVAMFLYPREEEKNKYSFSVTAMKLGFVNINTTSLYLYTNFYCCSVLVDVAIKIKAVQTTDDGNILVYMKAEGETEAGYKERSRETFVNMVYQDPVGQLHTINAVFNNK